MSRHARSRGREFCALLAGLILGQVAPAHAATFSVDPTQVFFSARVTSALVSLRNESDQPLRFQLSVFVWGLAPNGEMVLTPTRDIVFFPQLLTLAPREERKVRVGALVAPGAAEKTYRLFVEELPPPEGPTPGSVRVVTKVGIPIFLQPAKVQPQGQIRDLSYAAGKARFTVANAGNAHFVAERIRVQLLGRDGSVVAEQTINGWYILSAGRRDYEVDVTAPPAAEPAALVVEVVTGQAKLSERLAIGR